MALADNPVDAIWTSRPPAPIAPITLLDDAYAGEASAAKRARIGAEVGKAGAEVAVLSATGFDRLAAQPARRRRARSTR